ncbi:MAG: hypothetical protein HY532_09730, partial [Chloroflexi bacterium]|nr:hypothetical protein [Chloroflexota bacterium]
NAYLLIRTLGMPPDFFWKFDYWTQERAFETLQKVLGRVFAALFSKQKAGTLSLVGVNMEQGRFDVSFGDCAECAGMHSAYHICFFHAGIFAGVFGSLLDRDLDAVETECNALGAAACTFRIGKRDDREIAIPLDQRFSVTDLNVDLLPRAQAAVGHRAATRTIGDLVGIGYYQLLLSSSFLTNMSILSKACFNSGEELGRELAPLMPKEFSGTPADMIARFYNQLRHMNVEVNEAGGGVEVTVTEAPEVTGPLAQATLVPFICGELQSVLSILLEHPLRFQWDRQNGSKLVLGFSP